MSASKPGIAVWSLGNHARRNLVPAVASSRWNFCGVYSRDRGVTEMVARESGTYAYRSLKEMLADPAVAAVLIAGPNGLHFEQGRQALEAGKAVLIEKSFCETHGQTQELVTLAEARGLLIAECFGYLYHPQFEMLERLVYDRALTGEVASVTAQFGIPHREASDIRYRADLGGGALLDLGAYCLSAIARLGTGKPRVVWARLGQGVGYTVDISGQAVLAFENGATGFCDWGFGRTYRNRIELWGARALLATDRIFARPEDLATEITIRHQEHNKLELVTVAPANTFVAMLNHLALDLTDHEAKRRHRHAILDQATMVRAVRMAAA